MKLFYFLLGILAVLFAMSIAFHLAIIVGKLIFFLFLALCIYLFFLPRSK